MDTTKNANDNKTVSTKLDAATQSQLEAKAALLGVSVAEYLRNIAKDALAENVPVAPVVSNSNSPVSVAPAPALSENDLTAIVTAVSSVLAASLPVVAPTEKSTTVVNPEREYLRKISGLEPESDFTLNTKEEEYLSTLKQAIQADVTENLLLEQHSVPVPMGNALQEKMYKEMVVKRNEVISEKVPKMQSVFEQAIINAFFEDCKRLYNKGLFKATYGFDYSEFEAVFDK